MVLVAYDVNTATPEGRSRLRRVARVCKDYGQRVQNSVFECRLTPAQRLMMEKDLTDIIDEGSDSLRLYNLGANYRSKITHIGAKEPVDLDASLIF